jgi:hypothetical protein
MLWNSHVGNDTDVCRGSETGEGRAMKRAGTGIGLLCFTVVVFACRFLLRPQHLTRISALLRGGYTHPMARSSPWWGTMSLHGAHTAFPHFLYMDRRQPI